MSTSHLDRKEIKRPDAFLERANSAFHYINENSRGFLALLAVLFGLGLGYAFYSNMRDRDSEAANSALFTARKTLTEALEKTPKTTTDWEKSLKPSLEAVEQVGVKHRGTRASFEAFLAIGDVYYDRGDSAKAAEYYKRAADAASSKSVRALAQHSLAYAYENTKQYDLAIEALRQLIASGDKTLRGDALLASARVYALKGDKVKALEQYELVAKEFPNSQLAKTADMQKNLLR